MICRNCNQDRDLKFFELRKDTGKYRTQCCICRSNTRGHQSKILKIHEYDINASNNMKKCSKCDKYLSFDAFSLDKSTKYGRCSRCKECINKENKLKKELRFCTRLKKIYGLSPDMYEQLLAKQNYRCAICHTNTPAGKNGKLHVDHNHKTGKVRGLLCHHCNVALGSMNDSIDILNKAIQYLSK